MSTNSSRLLFILFFFLAPLGWAAGQAKRIGEITFILGRAGEVQLKHQGNAPWQNARLRMDVRSADVIRTQAESRCEVKLDDGSVVRIGEKSEFEFSQAAVSKASKKVSAQLKRGKVWSNITRLRSKKEGFQIKTPTAVCAVRGTIYRIDADSTTKCLVYDGEVDVGPTSFWNVPSQRQRQSKSLKPVEVPGPHEIPPPFEVTLEEWVRIVRGYQIIVRPDGKYAKSRFDEAEDAKLDWVHWNKQRDAELIDDRR